MVAPVTVKYVSLNYSRIGNMVDVTHYTYTYKAGTNYNFEYAKHRVDEYSRKTYISNFRSPYIFYINGFGRFQKLLTAVLCILYVCQSYHTMIDDQYSNEVVPLRSR